MVIRCCYNCEDRVVGCHSTCDKYLEEKRKGQELEKKIKKEKIQYSQFIKFKK